VSQSLTDIRTLQGSRPADWLRISAGNWPDRVSLATDTTEHTFGETNSRVNRVATVLRSWGVEKGDRVALFATDSIEYVEILLACMKLGATYVPLNFRLAVPELETLLRFAEPKVLFYSDRYTEMVRAVDAPTLERMVSIDSESGDAPFGELLATGTDEEIDTPFLDHELMCLAYTSGTTSLPKGVMHSQRMVKHMINQCIVDGRMTSIQFHYSAAPLFHVGGMLYTISGVCRGHSSLVLPAFDPNVVVRWMAGGRLDGVFLVPTMIDSILQLPGIEEMDFTRIKSIRYGAAPMSPALLRRALDIFGTDVDFMNMFGAGTEAGLQTMLTPEDHRLALDGREHLLGSIGKAGVGVVLRLCDDDLNDVPDGEVGEIVTRSDAVMSGYLDQPEATAEVLVDGWFRGGDMAWRDADGYLYLSGRKKDMIIRGGENIYPIEIEHVLMSHPSVREVAVVGVADEHWGEIVRAHIVPEPGREIDDVELREYCRAKIAGYKVPALFELHDELPRNASGKVLKRELRRL
jgi:acyl-CoA synthetase (AMP-forming)/AMP-acid ligase II